MYTARVSQGEATLATEFGKILIAPYSIEERERAPDFAALQRIASVSHGAFHPIGASVDLIDALRGGAVTEFEAKEIHPGNAATLLALFIFALAAEWIIRKRNQLL